MQQLYKYLTFVCLKFSQVTTKNGTRMVLSVSKTFMKLKDLILEKKTLQDQVEKMKAINAHLCTRYKKHLP